MHTKRTKLFLDIDGVLLGKIDGRIALARGASTFLGFVTAYFDCYWLTTHCQGDAETAQIYLKPYLRKELLKTIKKMKPTYFNVLKTDALPKNTDFFWVEDQPLASELKFLEGNGLVSCLIRVDTYANKEGLLECLNYLQKHLNSATTAKPLCASSI